MLVGVVRLHLGLPHRRRLNKDPMRALGTLASPSPWPPLPPRSPSGRRARPCRPDGACRRRGRPPATAAAARRRRIGSRVIGRSVRGRPIVAWSTSVSRGAEGGADLRHARQRGGPAPDPAGAAGRVADPRREPVGGPVVQPRRPRPRHPRERPRRRPEPQLPATTGPTSTGQLRVRPRPGLRAGDPGDDAVPARRAPRLGAQLPPAAVRRRQATPRRPPSHGGWRAGSTCPARRSPAAACATGR